MPIVDVIQSRFKRTEKCEDFRMWLGAYGKENVRADIQQLLHEVIATGTLDTPKLIDFEMIMRKVSGIKSLEELKEIIKNLETKNEKNFAQVFAVISQNVGKLNGEKSQQELVLSNHAIAKAINTLTEAIKRK